MGILLGYYGNAIEILWEHNWNIIGILCEHPGNTLAILWENNGNTMGITLPWKNCGTTEGNTWEHRRNGMGITFKHNGIENTMEWHGNTMGILWET